MSVGTWGTYKNLDLFFFTIFFFRLQTFNVFISHLILQFFAIGGIHLGTTVAKIQLAQIEREHSVYLLSEMYMHIQRKRKSK